MSANDETVSTKRSNPYKPRSSALYLAFLAPSLAIVILSFAFILQLHTHGAASASPWVANHSKNRPRQTAQVVTIIASILAATVTWSLSNSARILAQKRFFHQFRPIFEIEVFSALRHTGVVLGKHYGKRAMLATWVLFAACALMTSGFVTLISPLPIAKRSLISGTSELNLAASSDTCVSWYNEAMKKLIPTIDGGAMICDLYSFAGFSYSSCLSAAQLPQTLNAVAASILGYFASSKTLKKQTDFVSSFPTFNNTRILGGTGGTLPRGPGGIQVFSFPKRSQAVENVNYTLGLQGFWAETSCTYEIDSKFVFVLNQTISNMNQFIIACPGSKQPHIWDIPQRLAFNGLVIAYPCVSNDGISVYWRSSNFEGRPTLGAMDFLRCDLIPRIGNVRATYYSDLSAFKMLKTTSNFSSPTNLTDLIVSFILQEMRFSVYYAQSESGNAVADLVRMLGQSYGGLATDAWWKRVHDVPELVAQAIQGMFEFQATTVRIMLSAKSESDFPAPSECLQPVEGEMVERLIGWNLQKTTVLGLAPLLVVAIASLSMIILALKTGGQLTVFDPTSPVSLIAATSVGDVKFTDTDSEPKVIGHPEHKAVGQTKVSYGDHHGRWGLKSE